MCVVYWYSFSNPRTRCIHYDNCLVIILCRSECCYLLVFDTCHYELCYLSVFFAIAELNALLLMMMMMMMMMITIPITLTIRIRMKIDNKITNDK